MRSASLSACSIALWLGMCPCGMAGDVDHEQTKRIKQLRQSWTEKVHRISRREYEATLEYWSETAGPVFSFERVGQSTERLPIYLLKITEAAVPDRNKQVALIVSLHGGPESNAPANRHGIRSRFATVWRCNCGSHTASPICWT